ncbi:hypothetical protein SAMN05443667_101285 [Flavobacterium gillisiae]|jgi:hypothetical protein|uniref:Uncharacterized protein n=2 Tax=Flavobacterium TaxID=237 RepID=A0A1H3WXA6_9FLAO|nr:MULTISPECIES: hypothetical protein [Flavobacterium]SDX35234.1 hypothetical protein SAMN05444338_109117 [Flavobacterium degerlachei]SDZ91773.1 hypothetical protein SAMN05443667_101285 [Flavobacterium gillisiae]
MKKTLLGLAVVATLTLVSCKQETKDQVGEATDAIGTEMGDAVDTAAVKVDAALDSTKVKISNTMKEGAEKMDAKADKMKEDAEK